MGLREAVGMALTSSDLGEKDYRETDIDRVAALGKAGKLGRLLWHWKYGGDEHGKQAAFNLLVRRAAKRLKIRHVGEDGRDEYETLRRACSHVIAEWLSPNCPQCKGAREIVSKTLTVCPTCEGSGLRRYSDIERATAIHIDVVHYRKTWDRRVSEITLILAGADAETVAVVRTQLLDDEAKIKVDKEFETV